MKKKIIIALFNIFLIFVVFFSAEYMVYKNKCKQDFTENYKNTYFIKPYTFLPILNFKKSYENFLNEKENTISFPNTLYGNSKDKPILILGCSFAWGANLDDKDKFSGQLNKLTERTIYNRAIPGCGLNQALYMLQRGINVEKPEYIVYVFIEDHIRRAIIPCSFFDDEEMMFYKYDRNGKLIPKSDFDILYWHSYILRNLSEIINYKRHVNLAYTEEEKTLLTDLFILANKEAKAKFPGTKFIIFVYDGDKLIKNISETLKNNGIDEIIYLSSLSDIDFSDNKYKLEDDNHPNALAWQIITPLFVEKLNQMGKYAEYTRLAKSSK